MKVVCVIPARLNSKRFPRKVLSRLGSKPLLQWVWEAATACPVFNQVVFAVDHDETAHLVQTFQGEYFMTSENCPSGTDRLIELMDSGLLEGDIWVNWQGDEPFINREMIDDLLQSVEEDSSDVWTLKKKLTDDAEVHSPHVVKVVSDLNGQALYFSRAPIPYARVEEPTYYKHIGLYAYKTDSLKQIQKMVPTPLEKAESLEQLRFMEGGLKIKVHETSCETQGIDVPEDLLLALRLTSQFK
ncbi:3-deoxy-manno-octulosonate cytidylyltransferase [Simkania sp.]|uniref:3-deoxy-manno-octulosonate cytidylyltransferase n=1 Tax=Simkania sp. TaxID=34094 RepID=UPI003B527CF6